jgi:large subunit ribosomal protein L25
MKVTEENMSILKVERRSEGIRPKKLRRGGVLPMVLVERTNETVLLQAPMLEFRNALRGVDGHGTLQFQIEGERRPRKAIVRKIDLDALNQELLHATFQEVTDEDEVRVEVPIVIVGHSEDEGKGVTLSQVMDSLKVRGKLKDIPEHIEVSVTGLSAGEHIEVSALALPESIECLSASDATVVSLLINRAVELPTETADAATVDETSVLGSEG